MSLDEVAQQASPAVTISSDDILFGADGMLPAVRRRAAKYRPSGSPQGDFATGDKSRDDVNLFTFEEPIEASAVDAEFSEAVEADYEQLEDASDKGRALVPYVGDVAARSAQVSALERLLDELDELKGGPGDFDEDLGEVLDEDGRLDAAKEGEAEAGDEPYEAVMRLYAPGSLMRMVVDLERAARTFPANFLMHTPELPEGARLEMMVKLSPLDPLSKDEKTAILSNMEEPSGRLSAWELAKHGVRWLDHIQRTGRKWTVDADGKIETRRPTPLGRATVRKSDNPIEEQLTGQERSAIAAKLNSPILVEVALYTRVIGRREDRALLDEIHESASRESFPFQSDVEWLDCDRREWDCPLFIPAPKGKRFVATAEEYAALAHLPDAGVEVPGVKVRQGIVRTLGGSKLPTVSDPLKPPQGLIPFGIVSPDSINERVVALQERRFDTGFLITGMPGAGKSELAKHILLGQSLNGRPVFYIDPHGAGAADLLQALVLYNRKRIKDIIYISLNEEEMRDPANPDHFYSLAMNPLDIKSKSLRNVLKASASVRGLVESKMGINDRALARSGRWLRQAITALANANMYVEDPEAKLTLLHVAPFFTDDEFRTAVVDLCDVYDVRALFGRGGNWEMRGERERVLDAEPIVNRFSDIADGLFGYIFASPTNEFDPVALARANKIVIVNLANHSGNEGDFANFIAGWILEQLYSRIGEYGHDKRTGKGSGFSLWVDEASRIFAGERRLESILAELRKYHGQLGLIAQNTEQFERDVRDQILKLLGNVVTFYQGELSAAKTMAELIDASGPDAKVRAPDIVRLPNFYGYGKTSIEESDGNVLREVFSFKGLPPLEFPPGKEPPEMAEVRRRTQQLICNSSDDLDPRLASVEGDEETGTPHRRAMTVIALDGLRRAKIKKDAEQSAVVAASGPASGAAASTRAARGKEADGDADDEDEHAFDKDDWLGISEAQGP